MFLEISVFDPRKKHLSPLKPYRRTRTERFLFVVLKVSNNSVLGLFRRLVSEEKLFFEAPEKVCFWR